MAWLNSDDTYLDGAVTAAVDRLLAHPEAAMVYGQAWYTNAAGRQMRPYPTRSFDRKNLAAECFICQPAVFLRREVFQVVDLPDPSLRYCMDYDLWIRIAQHFEITSLEQFLATSRLHSDNKTIGERGGAIREAVQVSRRHFGAVHPNWALMYTQHQLSTTASRLRIPLETPRRRLLDHLASMYGNRIEAGPYDDGWAGPRTRVEVEGKAGDYVRAVIDFPVWPYAGVLRITAEHEGRILDVRHVRGPSTITLGFRLPESSSPQHHGAVRSQSRVRAAASLRLARRLPHHLVPAARSARRPVSGPSGSPAFGSRQPHLRGRSGSCRHSRSACSWAPRRASSSRRRRRSSTNMAGSASAPRLPSCPTIAGG